MNDDARFERLFADGLYELAPTRAPDRLRTKVKTATGEVHPRARWLALIKESPMRTNSHLTVGSPTARVAAIMVATLLAASMIVGAGIAGARIFAADGPIVVDPSGGGTSETITEAVAMAEDGDEILVRPGTYAEEIVIEKDITLRGDGPIDEVIIELADAVLIELVESDAEISDLTLRGDADTQGMHVQGGSPTISGVVFDGTGHPFGSDGSGDGGSLVIEGGSARVLGSRFMGGGEIMVAADADAVLEGNVLSNGPQLYLKDPGDEAAVRNNTISGTFDRAMGLFGPSTMTIEGNTIDGAGGDGITVGWNTAAGHDPLIHENDISGSVNAINVVQGAAPIVSGNRIHENTTGIRASSPDGMIRENELEGNDVGLSVSASAAIEDNTVRDNRVGLMLFGASSSPNLSGNTICDNEENVQPPGDAEPPVFDDSNEICEDAPAE